MDCLAASRGIKLNWKIPAATKVWGIPVEKLQQLKPDYQEELEFEAQQEAVLFSAIQNPKSIDRIVIAAADLAPNQEVTINPVNPELYGEWASELSVANEVEIKAFLISEEDTVTINNSEYAPQMLWFDPSELDSVLNFARGE